MAKTNPRTGTKLTPKRQAFVKHLVDNKTATGLEAAKAAYGKPGKPISDTVAKSMASELLADPVVKSELAKYNNLVESTLVNTINEWGGSDRPREREIAQNAAMYVHDKVHGRATQRVEQQSTVVMIGIDMTQPAPTEQ